MASDTRKTKFKLRTQVDKPCPFCHCHILVGDDIVKTLQGESHAICPAELFLRKFKNAGLIRKEAKKVEFHKIPLILDFLSRIFNVKLWIMISSERRITKEEARDIDKKMEAIDWASQMFLKKEGLGIARSKDTGFREITNQQASGADLVIGPYPTGDFNQAMFG